MEDLLARLGGGFALRTEVAGVPSGSGLGTSCILSAACIKALYEFMGLDFSAEAVCGRVMTAEQLMSTGGGWEDQIGALWPGVK
jgi:fucokinase